MNIIAKVACIVFAAICYGQVHDKIVGVVNDNPITQFEVTELKQLMHVSKMLNDTDYNKPDIDVMVLNYMIERALIKEYADAIHFTHATPKDDRLVTEFLQNHNMSSESLHASLDSNNISKATFVAYLKESLNIEMVTQKVIAAKIHISDAKIAAYKKQLKQHGTQYLLQDLYLDPATLQEKDRATFAAFMEHAAMDFYSGKTIDNRIHSVNLGYRPIDELPEIYQASVPHLQQGKVSAPIDAPNGQHYLLLLNKRSETI